MYNGEVCRQKTKSTYFLLYIIITKYIKGKLVEIKNERFNKDDDKKCYRHLYSVDGKGVGSSSTLAEVTNAGRAIVAGTVEDKAKMLQAAQSRRWSCR